MRYTRKALIAFAMAALAMLIGAAAQAEDYRPPRGFNDYEWGTRFESFRGLKLWHAGKALDSGGKVVDTRITCVPANSAECMASSAWIDQLVEGSGSFALGEYYLALDRNPWVEQHIDLATISYLFCAFASSGDIPKPLTKHLTLCGTRVIFRSDKLEALAKRGDHYESNYDRILHQLVAEYGAPPGYELHGQITVESADQRLVTPDHQRPEYKLYRWCGVAESAIKLHPVCDATITLSFEQTTGWGTILFATAPVYDFAYARHEQKDENNELYALLHSEHPERKAARVVHQCTGSHLCEPSNTPMTAKQMKEFEP